jgi:outer membrane beta-barrel protein
MPFMTLNLTVRTHRQLTAAAVLCIGILWAGTAVAQSSPGGNAAANPPNEQVIEPQVSRRPVKLPRFPSNDFSAGVFAGTYGTENFGSSMVAGLRLGYHITEDIFVEAAFAQTKVSDEAFRQVLPGGIFETPEETLTYYNLSAGFNVLPGEIFIGRNIAKASGIYLIGGIGSTKFIDQRRQTFNVGLGLRVFLKDWAAIQVDMRDHIYPLDLLGKRKDTQNLELTAGLTFFF